MRWVTGALLLAACARDPDPDPDSDPDTVPTEGTCDDVALGELPDCDVVDACVSRDTANPIDCVHRLRWSKRCDAGFHEGTGGLTHDGLLFVGEFMDPSSTAPASFTLTDAAAFDAWLAAEFYGEPPAMPAVDFARQVVVVMHAHQTSTCGMSVVRHGVWSDPNRAGTPTEVYLEVEDSSGSCFEVCAMDQRSGVVYAVDRDGGDPTPCALLVDRCG